jgi:hypothetical protein
MAKQWHLVMPDMAHVCAAYNKYVLGILYTELI